jgi:hypothetical protein
VGEDVSLFRLQPPGVHGALSQTVQCREHLQYDHGNPATVGEPTFTPLGAPASNLDGPNFTPPFPASPSGHAGFGAALFETLRHFYGTDRIAFTFVSDEFNGVTRDNEGIVRPRLTRGFSSLSEAEEENGQVADRFRLAHNASEPIQELLHWHRWHSPSAAVEPSPAASAAETLSMGLIVCLNACLILLGRGAPVGPGNPYATTTQDAFATWGTPIS